MGAGSLPRLVVAQVLVVTNRPGGMPTPPSPLSSRHSSQDSLHKGLAAAPLLPGAPPMSAAAAAAAQKKKGIKSSLGRFFSKKEKVSASSLPSWWSSLALGNTSIWQNQPHS
ncbi:hypothetical protein PR048_029717 [Dryococelus australis]|uniref:Uncharacterized protein n=1 Tax=Dryococelus australis TaxID=614101 RepID=A0ABQ9GEF7_9NEOP|nr:hypothetical protein PR048_029717 [Dryococelus australis]